MNKYSTMPARDQCVVDALLHKWSREQPSEVFLLFEDNSQWTFAETLLHTRQAAAGLKSLGVEPGSHVLCWLPNCQQAILTWFGANYLGATFVPINTAYRGSLLQHVIALSDAKVLVVHADLLPRLQNIDTASLRDIVVVGGDYEPATGVNYHSTDVLQPAAEVEAAHDVQPWHTNYIIFTSGTTGPSKQCSAATCKPDPVPQRLCTISRKRIAYLRTCRYFT